MKLLIAFLTLLILSGCQDNREKSVTQNDRLELVPEPDKEMREMYAQQKDSLTKATELDALNDTRLKPVKDNFKRINEIKAWSSIDKRTLNESTEGGTALYFIFQDSILKISVTHFGETGKKTQEFFTKDGQLSFVFEKEYRYNRPISWDSTAMNENNDIEVFDAAKSEITEDRSYFVNGILIKQINNQDCGSPFSKEHLLEEQKRIKSDFENLLQLRKTDYPM